VGEARRAVLAIGGTGQNGATLLSRMLGEVPGLVAVGEVGRLWDKGIVRNTECGCGLPFRDCPFWSRVGEAAFGGWDAVDTDHVIALRDRVQPIQRRIALPRTLPLMLRPSLSPPYAAARAGYAGYIARLFDGVRAVSGAHTVVDSMKLSSHVYMLRALPETDVRVVHLVRDSRGVAYSSVKTVEKVGGKIPYRGKRHPVRTAVRWTWINLSFDLLRRLGVPTAMVRYEAVVARPRETVMEILRFAEVEPLDGLPFIQGRTVELPPAHVVAGNRVRMQRGPIELREDDAWRSKLPIAQRRLVSGLTWPLLRRYSRPS
jgi:hypothetical protein